jgi:hypothetical protein
MKRQLFFGALFAAAISVGMSAQTPQTPSSTAQQPSRAKNQEVTLTGCLQTGSGSSTTGTSGTAASGSQKSGSSSMSGGEFVLANAKMGGSSGASAAGTAGSPSGAASSSSAADRYKLVGHQNDLRKYANSQVEVRGTIESKASSTSGSGDTPSAAASSSSSEPTLRVSSVKQTAPSCSGGN